MENDFRRNGAFIFEFNIFRIFKFRKDGNHFKKTKDQIPDPEESIRHGRQAPDVRFQEQQ
jgi:hypothetical protein